MQTTSLNLLYARLRTEGWASLSLRREMIPNLADKVVEVACGLGDVVAGSGRTPVEVISPRSQTNARPASLSRHFGDGPLPLHCDTAHWTIPCRYIVLACEIVGRIETPTLLLDTRDLKFSDEERLLARSATFLVRNGWRSFYASLIDSQQSFVRIDPGCMEPVTEASVAAMQLYHYESHRSRVISFAWNAGDILIIDNWRVLHGRGNESTADSDRRLIRAYVQ
jgi:Taurine catabolism dioxygenase TauD, TfdA family